MLLLFETASGYAIFKVLDEHKLQEAENLSKDFETLEKASDVVQLLKFHKFTDTTEGLAAVTGIVDGTLNKPLRKVLKKLFTKEPQETLAVADAKLGGVIKDKLNIKCVHSMPVIELTRCVRSQISNLLPQKESTAMALGLAHSLSRYRLKFNPEKVDTMIQHSIGLLDEADKEINNYVMRLKEFYGWHFPELSGIVTDNLAYVKTVKVIGFRSHATSSDLSEVLPEDLEAKVKSSAILSMGTEISDYDLANIHLLCDRFLNLSLYRNRLYEYIRSRMTAITPNLTSLVGELVGARLIAKAGSLLNLAKYPASTVQILGAEKALFRALKTKHDTPKYGLIYHASLVGHSAAKLKGKMSRMLANKVSLASRVDAIAEEQVAGVGPIWRAKLEARLKSLEEQGPMRISGLSKQKAKFEKYENRSEVKVYDTKADFTLPTPTGQKRAAPQESPTITPIQPPAKKIKVEVEPEKTGESVEKSKKKKKRKHEDGSEQIKDVEETPEAAEKSSAKKEKKKRKEIESTTPLVEELAETTSPEKKKKKRKSGDIAPTTPTPQLTPATDGDISMQTSTEKKKKKKKKDKSGIADTPQTDSAIPNTGTGDSETKKKKKRKEKTD